MNAVKEDLIPAYGLMARHRPGYGMAPPSLFRTSRYTERLPKGKPTADVAANYPWLNARELLDVPPEKLAQSILERRTTPTIEAVSPLAFREPMRSAIFAGGYLPELVRWRRPPIRDKITGRMTKPSGFLD
jgi:hypothetical protein